MVQMKMVSDQTELLIQLPSSKMRKSEFDTSGPFEKAIFKFKDARGYNRALTAGKAPPLKIAEYTINPADWAKNNELKPTTVEDVLVLGLDAGVPCQMCGSGGEACEANDCINEFRRQVSAYGEKITEIRTVPGMGKGVFTTCNIPSGVWIGEYLGELIPPQLTSLMQSNMYLFEFDEKVSCDASMLGNWTRFMNHHCRPNVKAKDCVYARRKVIGFKTARRIKKGEQLFISYGEEYFKGNGLLCRCDGFPRHHMPQELPSPSADGTARKTADPERSVGKAIGEEVTTVKSTALGPKCRKITRFATRAESKRNARKRKADILGLRNCSQFAKFFGSPGKTPRWPRSTRLLSNALKKDFEFP